MEAGCLRREGESTANTEGSNTSKPIVDQSDLKDIGNKITVKEHFDVGELTPEQKKQKIKEFTKKLRRLKKTPDQYRSPEIDDLEEKLILLQQ